MIQFRKASARRAAAALAAAALLLTGCSVDGASAARVGANTLSQSQLGEQTDALLATSENGDRAAVNRLQLTTHIRHELLVELAAARQIVVGDAEIQEQLAGIDRAAVAAQLGVGEADLPRAVFDALVLQQVAQAALEQPLSGEVVSVEVDGLVAADREAAVLLQAQLAGPDGDRVFADRSAAGPTETVPLRTMSNTDPETAGAGSFGVFSASAGDVLVIEENGQYLVLRIKSRSAEVGAIDLQPFTQLQNGLELVTPLLLAEQAESSGVTVNPRFGRWDPVAVAVVR